MAALETRAVTIEIQQTLEEDLIIDIYPSLAGGGGVVVLEQKYPVTITAGQQSVVANLPVLPSGAIKYTAIGRGVQKAIFPKRSFFLSDGAATTLDVQLALPVADSVIDRAVRYDIAQDLTTAEKLQARTNIGAGTGGGGGLSDGDYGDITVSGSATVFTIDNSAVSTAKIADSAITTAKLGSGAVTDAKVSTGIDAAKIGGGAVSNTEFGYLDGVTSAIQTQLDAKQAILVSGTNLKTINGSSILGSGDLTVSGGGSYPSITDEAGVVTIDPTSEVRILPTSGVAGLDIVGNSASLGDFDNIGNGTLLAIDDVAQTINVTGTFQINGSALSKSSVGLGNVDNTSDATKNSATATLTNKTISGASNTFSNIPTSAVVNLSGTNTGDQTLNGLLPSQTGNSGKYLTTDGTDASWATVSGGSGITSINGDTSATQTISGADDISVATTGGATTVRRAAKTANDVFISLPLQFPLSAAATSAGTGANGVNCYAFTVDKRQTVSKIAFRLMVGSAGGNASAGVYSSDGNTKLIDSGAISTASTGNKSTTLGSSVTLEPGIRYWMAYTVDNATATARAFSRDTDLLGLINANNVLVGTAANASSAGVLPSTLGTISSNGFSLWHIVLFG